MRGVVVENDVNDLGGGSRGLDGVEEPDELLMPMTLHLTSDHRVDEDVERGEQRGRSVPLVIVGLGPGAALLQRQAPSQRA